MGKKLAVYAGSFDPVTNGHLWMIERGADLFDELIVAVGVNPDKRKYLFSIEERVGMILLLTEKFSNVRVETFEEDFLPFYAQSVGAQFLLRGIRSESDYEQERMRRYVNDDINPDIMPVFLMPSRGTAEISSSMVKGLIGPKRWEEVAGKYVPQVVFDKLREAHLARRV